MLKNVSEPFPVRDIVPCCKRSTNEKDLDASVINTGLRFTVTTRPHRVGRNQIERRPLVLRKLPEAQVWPTEVPEPGMVPKQRAMASDGRQAACELLPSRSLIERIDGVGGTVRLAIPLRWRPVPSGSSPELPHPTEEPAQYSNQQWSPPVRLPAHSAAAPSLGSRLQRMLNPNASLATITVTLEVDMRMLPLVWS